MKIGLFKKGLVVGVILLFVGVAVAPGINANVKSVFDDPKPDLDCDGELTWADVEPGSTVEGAFTVENIGDNGSLLNWEIESYPEWGTWISIPSSGDNLTPENGAVTVWVECIAPEVIEETLWGEIKIINRENTSDYCTVSAVIMKPRSENSQLVEITTEFCGLDGRQPHTVKLTTQEAQDLEKLFDDIKLRLYEVKTREETIQIFNEAVVKLDKFGLLGDINIEKAQQLITGKYAVSNKKQLEMPVSLNKKVLGIINDRINIKCLTTGYATETTVLGSLSVLFFLLTYFLRFTFYPLLDLCPVLRGGIITHGHSWSNRDEVFSDPSEGWTFSNGLLGIRFHHGDFYGNLIRIEDIIVQSAGFLGLYYVASFGFEGIRLYRFQYDAIHPVKKTFYLGSTLLYKVSS
jgi:hypothetical protein